MREQQFDKNENLELEILVKEHQEGNKEATNKLVEKMSNYVYHLFHKHYGSYLSAEEDLIQEGFVGVMKGLKKYDPKKGALTTFIKPYIIHEMQEYFATEILKTTSYYAVMTKKVWGCLSKMGQAGLEYRSPEDFCRIYEDMFGEELSPTTFTAVMQIMTRNEHINIQDPANEFMLECQKSFQIDAVEQTVIRNLEKADISKGIDKSLKSLSDDQKTVVALHYGLSGKDKMSKISISKELGIEYGAVKRLIDTGLTKMKRSLSHAV